MRPPRRCATSTSYFLAPQDVKEGDLLHSGADAPIRPGNTLPLSAIPVGMAVHNVELRPGAGGQLARAAGTACTLVKKGEARWVARRLDVGEHGWSCIACCWVGRGRCGLVAVGQWVNSTHQGCPVNLPKQLANWPQRCRLHLASVHL